MIDLAILPAPQVIEPLDYESILAALKADLLIRLPALADTLELESEPVVKLLEISAYRELTLRARINDAARAVLLSHASGADLDNLAALFGVARLLLDAGDPNAAPPIPPTYESDSRLRVRAQMTLEGFSTAGPRGAYVFHALTADPAVYDVAVDSPLPGQVRVTLLAADGIPAPATLVTVAAALNAESVRPLCDTVSVEAASLIPYSVTATLECASDPAAAVVLAAAQAALATTVAEHYRLGRNVPRSALYAALHRPGVLRVELTAPIADVAVAVNQAAQCSTQTVTLVLPA